MSTDIQLSKQRMGTDLPSGSKKVDKELFTLITQVGIDLSEKYGVEIIHVPFLANIELSEHISEDRDKHVLQAKNPEKTGIKPDGGMLLARIGKKRKPLLAAENKKQGDGKNQAKGNAIERASKNIMFLQTCMAKEKILPYLFFCYGKDFGPRSYIIDRLATMTHNYPLNRINLFKDADNLGGASIFYREDLENAFSKKEMYQIAFEIAEKSLLYYFRKYGKEVCKV